MKKAVLLALTSIFVLAVAIFGMQSPRAAADEPKLLEFDRMVGNTSAFTGATTPIRGINGGGIPWMLTSGFGELKASGELEVTVQGLVLAAGPNTGINPISTFRVIVSCYRGDGSVQNILTDPFPATTGTAANGGGNASIETFVSLPRPCIAPLVFVTSPGGAWFATIGQ